MKLWTNVSLGRTTIGVGRILHSPARPGVKRSPGISLFRLGGRWGVIVCTGGVK